MLLNLSNLSKTQRQKQICQPRNYLGDNLKGQLPRSERQLQGKLVNFIYVNSASLGQLMGNFRIMTNKPQAGASGRQVGALGGQAGTLGGGPFAQKAV